MTWLKLFLSTRWAQAGALFVAFLGWLSIRDRRQRKKGAQGVTDKLKEADNAEANAIRRRSDAARELRDADSGRGFRD